MPPRFGFRGIFLDCARHFHTPATIKRLLKLMSLYKFNRFHWHLTDDEGWRLEIKAFPALTDVGAWRGHDLAIGPQLSGGAEPYGGYYTQSEVKELVSYASELGITVIPEIDIPGHCHAAIKALPELLVEAADHSRYLSVQHFDDNVLNPALPGTYRFLEAVLDEVCELFPGPQIHMGGDEVPTGVWTDSPACQQLMAEQGYSDCRELQGHLLRHCQRYLADKGKRMIGWEEILHGDKVSRNAAVCAWTSFQAGLDAAAAGYPVVMAPAQSLYLDLAWSQDIHEPGLYWAGTLNLEQVYACDPAPADFHANDNILGVLSPLWSELNHLARSSRLHVVPAHAGHGRGGLERSCPQGLGSLRRPPAGPAADPRSVAGALPDATEVMLSLFWRPFGCLFLPFSNKKSTYDYRSPLIAGRIQLPMKPV